MFFKCGKTNYLGEIFVHAASDHSITQVSQIFLVIVKTQGIQYHNIVHQVPIMSS